ncbi:MAG: M15 family metallopeptidase [Spirochaetes bacterium]|nr:M15 family metallopeptidase [Spirochaetota bacterium]
MKYRNSVSNATLPYILGGILALLCACTQKGNPAPLHPHFTLSMNQLLDLIQNTPRETGVKIKDNPQQFLELLDGILHSDRELVLLVDKRHPLPKEYEPKDLVSLDSYEIRTSRPALLLRKKAAQALSQMAKEAKKEGIELLVSSAYRSFQYQSTVYKRVVQELGQEVADRESAKPGHSQHQLGTAVDFGSISDSFTGTPMERWLRTRAWEFGFSLSYPEGKEAETGYRHESWHYRFLGKDATQLEREFFFGNQQRMLEFLHIHWETLQKVHRFSSSSH